MDSPYFSLPKFQPELAFQRYKQLRRSATPPPRRIADGAAKLNYSEWRGMWLPLALAVTLLAVTLGVRRPSPTAEPLRDALNASTVPPLR